MLVLFLKSKFVIYLRRFDSVPTVMSQRDGFATERVQFIGRVEVPLLDSALCGILKAEHRRDVAQRDCFKTQYDLLEMALTCENTMVH